MAIKEILSGIAMLLTFIAFAPYIRSVLNGTVKPHIFSWAIWGITTCSVFFAQLADNGGAGAWAIGFSGSITLFIAILAYNKRGDISITPSDWAFFSAALAALPIWFFTNNPIWAVMVLTTVDLLGFGPTIRKTWHHPYSESLTFMVLFLLRNLLVLTALEHYSVTTALFPAAVAAALTGLIVMMVWRRNQI